MLNPNSLDWFLDSESIAKSIILVVCIVLAIIYLYEKFDTIINKLGITTKKSIEKKQHEESQNKQIEELKAALDKSEQETSANIEKISNTLDNVTAVLATLQNSVNLITADLNTIHSNLDKIEQVQKDQDDKAASARKAQYKQILYKAYYTYKERYDATGVKEWTSIESDGFWTMFRDYERYDTNSRLHTEVEPFMLTFKIVDR